MDLGRAPVGIHDPSAGTRRCDGCQEVLVAVGAGDPYTDVLPDSSWIDPVDSDQDGRRPVTTCSRPCLDRVGARLASRPYATDELWAGKVFRAVMTRQRALGRAELELVTGLTTPQIRAAFTWLEEHAA